MVLTLLAILIAALVVLAVAGRFVPRRIAVLACAGLAGVGAVLAVVALSVPGEMAAGLVLPIGPPATSVRLALDPLGASFLLLVFVVAAFDAVCGEAAPLRLAGLVLALLAADGFALVVGVAAGGITLQHPHPNPPPLRGRGSIGRLPLPRSGGGLGWGCVVILVSLIVAFALLDPLDAGFTAIRATPPEGWAAAAILALTLAASTLLARANGPLAVYLLIRVVLDLSGPTQPAWWSIPLLLLGAATTLLGPLRAVLADTLRAVATAGSLHQLGLATIGVGVALLAHAVDLPAVSSLALQAVWLSLVCHALCRSLLLRCADAVGTGADTERLDRLGGLLHRMPATGLACLAGLFAAVALPPGLGFAAFWLLFQSLLAVARAADFSQQLLIAVVAVLVAASVGLTTIASVRLFAVVFLGRPRTPRAAVAEEPPAPQRWAQGGQAALTGLLGVLPGLALLPATGWLGAGVEVMPLALRAGAEAPGYAPIGIAGLLVLAAMAGLVVLRRSGAHERRSEAAWSGGFAAPPAWLPFGDPATQVGPVSFVEPLRRIIARLPRPTPDWTRVARWRDVLLTWLAAA